MTSRELTLFFAWNLLKLESLRLSRCRASKKWRLGNIEAAKAACLKTAKRWREKNPEQYNENNRKAYRNNPVKAKEAKKRWLKKPGEKQDNQRLIDSLRRRINKVLAGTSKAGHTLELLGCSTQELRAHLEKQFQPGMSWATRCLWHVDHIRPCADFPDLSDPEQQKACFHFTNLQPLWAIENLQKGDTCGR